MVMPSNATGSLSDRSQVSLERYGDRIIVA